MIDTNSNVLGTVSNSIDAFLALPVYSILSDVPSDLSLKLFIPSKDNTSVLSGTQETFRSLDLSGFDFTLPVKAVKPDKPVKPDPFTGKAKQAYYDDLEAWSDWDTTDPALLNVEIERIATRLLQHDIQRKFAKLQRVCQFVQSHDPAMFDHQEELDLFQLSETQRKAILAVYQQHFALTPRLNLTGSFVDLVAIDPACSLDSIEGIDAIIKIKNNNPSASYAFMSKEITIQALQPIYGKVNQATYVKCFSRLDCHAGGSKNSTTIVANLRMLHGFQPTKGKKAQ